MWEIFVEESMNPVAPLSPQEISSPTMQCVSKSSTPPPPYSLGMLIVLRPVLSSFSRRWGM